MTHPDDYTMRAANALPHRDRDPIDLTVESIMAERGVGKKRAYAIVRELSAARYEDAVVPTNQRERVLAMLWRADGSVADSKLLMEALQQEGYAIDGHDTTKVLWSLQKTGHVKFREHQSPKYLYAIRLTDLGKADGRKYATNGKTVPVQAEVAEETPDVFNPQQGWIEEAPEVRDESTVTVEEDGSITQHTRVVTDFVVAATALQQEINDLGAGAPEPEPTVPWVRGNMGGWPTMREVRDRARKVTKIREAAALLEEVGEDDAVLALLDKIEFTPLEEEVVQLLRFLKEIE